MIVRLRNMHGCEDRTLRILNVGRKLKYGMAYLDMCIRYAQVGTLVFILNMPPILKFYKKDFTDHRIGKAGGHEKSNKSVKTKLARFLNKVDLTIALIEA